MEFTGLHKDTTAVTQIHFLSGQVSAGSASFCKETSCNVRYKCVTSSQGRLLSLLDDNTIHLWELVARPPQEVGGLKKEGVVSLQEVTSYSLPGRPGIESCRYSPTLCFRFVSGL